MAVEYEIPVPLNFRGLDFGSDGISANPNNARSLKNVRRLAAGDLTDREGSKVVASSVTGITFGTFCYKRTDPTSFIETNEILVAGTKLWKLVEHTLSLEYSGAGQAIGQFLYDTTINEWVFSLFVESVEVLNYPVGVGFDESVVALSGLVTAIDNLTDFAATAPTAALILPAAMLPSLPPTAFVAGSPQTLSILIKERKVINQPTGASDPFAGTYANRNASNFENISSVEDVSNIYFASKYDEQKKYDGNDVYRAGAPTTSLVSTVGSGAGGLALGTYSYIASVVQIDQNGLEVESDESLQLSVTTVGPQNINVTVNNILNTTGFNTDCGVVAGAQVSVNTITLDNGSGGSHTLKLGQNAYFYDAVSSSYVVREITGIAATTITITGAAVTVADNAVISNNLRIRLRRTVTTGSIYKQLVDLPNNSFTATQVYNDGISDSALGANYTSPAELGVNHGLPPKAAYLAKYNGRPVACGLAGDPSAYAWASVQGPEYYPNNYSDIVSGESNAPITGAKAGDRYLWIHQGSESFLITGDLFANQYSSSKKGDRAGCEANASISDTDMGMVWLGDGAFYGSVDGATPTRISGPIETIFSERPQIEDRKLIFKRAVSVWDSQNKLYICFIPCESSDGIDTYANFRSRIYVYDMRLQEDGTVRGDWFQWDTWNMAGGACYDEKADELYWSERYYSIYQTAVVSKTFKRLNTNTIYDQIDHSAPVSWNFKPNWFHGGQPTVFKKFISFALFSFNTELNAYGTVKITSERDFSEGNTHSSLEQDFGTGSQSQGWGFGSWGFFPWGQPYNSKVKPRRLKNGSATAFRLCFSGGAVYTKMVLTGYQLLVGSPYKIDLKGAHPNG